MYIGLFVVGGGGMEWNGMEMLRCRRLDEVKNCGVGRSHARFWFVV